MEFGPNELTVHRRSQRNPRAYPNWHNELASNMLAEDARRHEGETMPPRDRYVPELSVMDTAFLSPEQHGELAGQSEHARFMRQIEDPGLISDYPEDWVAGGFGLFQLGKGLTKYGLKHLAKQRPPRTAGNWTTASQIPPPTKKPVFTDLKQAATAAKQNKPDKFKPAMQHKQNQLNAKLAAAQKKFKPKDFPHPDHLLDPVDIAEQAGLPDDLIDLLGDNYELLKKQVDPYLPATEMLERSFQVIEDLHRPFPVFGGQGSNLPVPKWMSAPTKTMRIPPASANSIPAAAVLHESMAE